MIDYDNIQLQEAANRLASNRDLAVLIEAIKSDLQNSLFNTKLEEDVEREDYYKMWKATDQIKDTVTALLNAREVRLSRGTGDIDG